MREKQIMTGLIPVPQEIFPNACLWGVSDLLHPIIRDGEFTGHPVRNLRRLAVAVDIPIESQD